MKRICLAVLFFLSAWAEARVFNYKDSSLGAFVRGTAGLIPLDQDAFANSSGGGVAMTGASKFDYGGEIGFLFGFGQNFHLRLGAEILQPNTVKSVGTNSSNVQYFDLNSSAFIFNPNVTFEMVYSVVGNMRFFGELGAGYATINVTNDYKMTAAGTAALGGVTDFKETLDGTALNGTLGFGMEALFADNCTLMLDFGYRYFLVNNLKYGSDVKNIVKPAGVSKGDAVLNQDGSNRKLNLSGMYGGLGFRFYFNFL